MWPNRELLHRFTPEVLVRLRALDIIATVVKGHTHLYVQSDIRKEGLIVHEGISVCNFRNSGQHAQDTAARRVEELVPSPRGFRAQLITILVSRKIPER